MLSYWNIKYKGPNTGIFIKKFERFLGLKIYDCTKERYILGGIKFERIDFFIELESQNWNDSIIELLNYVSRITPEWIVTINADTSISGIFDPKINEKKGWESQLSGPTGLYSITWLLTANQQYDRIRMIGDNKSEW